jgi:Putative prokaryotic signal transducing protein
MREGTVVAEFLDPWEARLAQHSLADAGLEAWLEGPGPDRRLLGEATGRIRLLVPDETADEAREVLAADEEPASTRRRPMWITVAAAVLVVGLVWGAVPRFLWPWILLAGFVGFLLWRAAGPRRP